KMPAGTVQLIYRTSHEDGARLVADHRLGATGYTGSRSAGLTLKKAADAAGKPIYLELSSVNPVVILPGALRERSADLVIEFVGSALLGAGQFCTKPGMVGLIKREGADEFIAGTAEKYRSAPVGTLLSESVEKTLAKSIGILTSAGAKQLA